MNQPIIQVKSLVKEFKTYDRRTGISGAFLDLFHREYKILKAVNGVSFEIQPGEMVGYIGANGAGKSTTIKALCGILHPTSGHVEVGGRVPWQDREAHVQRIGAVFGQRSQLWWDLAAGESLHLVARIFGVSDCDYAIRMEAFNDVLGLNDFLSTPVRKLSLGQKMRCELAAALIHAPPILFLDEPTIGLDVMARQSIRAFLRKINAERDVTMILTTHDLREIEELCGRVIIIDHGKIVFDGSMDALKSKALHKSQIRFQFRTAPRKTPEELGISVVGVDWELKGAEYRATLFPHAPPRTEVIKRVLEKCGENVLDIHIEEPQIEQIVQGIYGTASSS